VCNLEQRTTQIPPKYAHKLRTLFPDAQFSNMADVVAPPWAPRQGGRAAPTGALPDDALALYQQAASAVAALYRLAKAAPSAPTPAAGRTLTERRSSALQARIAADIARVTAHYDRLRAAWDASDWTAYTAARDELAAQATTESRESALLAYIDYHGRLPDPRQHASDRAIAAIFGS